MKFGMMTHFDPLKPKNRQNFEFLKIQDGGWMTSGHVQRLIYSKWLNWGQNWYSSHANWGVLHRMPAWGAYSQNLANMTELSMCSSDATLLVHGRDHYFRSVCLFVCLFVCAEFFSAVFDPIWIKLGHMLHTIQIKIYIVPNSLIKRDRGAGWSARW